MYLWRRLATPRWWAENKEDLRERFGCNVAVIARPNRKQLQIEIALQSRNAAHELVKEFKGRLEKLPRDWLKRFLRQQKTKALKLGKHRLTIPAGAAFGTGEHATTAMSLRLLERAIKCWGAHAPSPALFGAPAEKPSKSLRWRGRHRQHARRLRSPELVVDLGTGSGILALAARLLGAKRAIGLDYDPLAISTAKQNARRNKIDNVQFLVADVRRWKFPRKIDIVTANLFSDLLIEILPRLKDVPRLILSGILREQEAGVTGALKQNRIDIIEVCRRGKWVAILGGQLRRS